MDSKQMEMTPEQISRIRQWLDGTPDSFSDEPPFHCRRKSSLAQSLSLLSSTSTELGSSICLSEHKLESDHDVPIGCFLGISNLFKYNKHR
jgi:hypothetical protein